MWEINLNNQFATLIYSLVLGIVLCVFYDILRALRKVGFNSFLAVFMADFLFWVLSAFATFLFLTARTYGEIRGYVLIGELFGFLLARFTVSKLTLPFFKFIFVYIKRFFILFDKLLSAVYSKIDRLFSKIGAFAVKIFNIAVKSIKKLLKNVCKVLYTNKNKCDAEYVLDETKT